MSKSIIVEARRRLQPMWGALHATASLECRVPQNAAESDTERQETANGLFQPCFNRGVFHESNREPLCRIISGRSQPQPNHLRFFWRKNEKFPRKRAVLADRRHHGLRWRS